jgi:hypothetical protein
MLPMKGGMPSLALACAVACTPLASGTLASGRLAEVVSPPAVDAALPQPWAHVDPRAPALTADNGQYEVMLYTAGVLMGKFAAATGVDHPLTSTVLPLAPREAPCSVLRVGSGHNMASVRSYTSNTDYLLGRGQSPSIVEPGFACVDANDVAAPTFASIVSEGLVVGARATWTLSAPDELVIDEEIRVIGDSFASASVATTLRVTNLASDPIRFGLRVVWNTDIHLLLPGVFGGIGTAGPNLAFRPPTPPMEPYLATEGEWTSPTARSWEQHGMLEPSRRPWLYFLGGSLGGTQTAQPRATPPALFQYVAQDDPLGIDLRHACFSLDLPVPHRRVGGDFGGPGAALAYLWGIPEDRAFELLPGESREVTAHAFAYLQYPVTCDAGEPQRVECTGESTLVSLDGSGSRASDGSPLAFRWTSGDPRVVLSDPSLEDPVASFASVGSHDLELAVEVGPYGITCGASVEVVDTTPPVITVPAIIERRTSEGGAEACGLLVGVAADGEDICASHDIVFDNDRTRGGRDASDHYPVGDTLVGWVARDPSGNESADQTIVRVIDDTPPVFTTLRAEPAVLWPPNHRLVPVSVAVQALDNCGVVHVRLVRVMSNEPADGLGDGDTQPDIVDANLGDDDGLLRLRAERSGLGSGRRYTLVYEAEDAHGNAALGSVTVSVPHDMGRGP